MLKPLYWSVSLLLAALFSAQLAQAAGDISLKLTVAEEIVVTDAKGKKLRKLVAAKEVEPGDVVVYTIHYHNQAKQAASGLVINDPIPQDTIYIANSASQGKAKVTFSVDGKHFSPSHQLMVKKASGKLRLARLDEYRHIRWTLKAAVASGEKGKVSFKARVK